MEREYETMSFALGSQTLEPDKHHWTTGRTTSLTMLFVIMSSMARARSSGRTRARVWCEWKSLDSPICTREHGSTQKASNGAWRAKGMLHAGTATINTHIHIHTQDNRQVI